MAAVSLALCALFFASSDVEVELRLRLEPALSVELTVACLGAEGGESSFEVDEQWGGVSAGGLDLALVGAFGAEGRKLDAERPEAFRWTVHHEPGEALQVRFRLDANRHQESGDPDTNRRPILNEHLFHAVGTLLLPLPKHLERDVERDVRIRWSGFEEAGWQVMSAFGEGEGLHRTHTTLDRVRNALYVAGDLRVYERLLENRPVFVTIAGDGWGFDDDSFVALVADLVAYERGFFADWNKPVFWVSLIGAGPPSDEGRSMGGTALTNGFSLIMNPDATLAIPSGPSMGVQRLLAHEMFHEWNGITIEREAPEELAYWFSEGFTNFYARRLLFRGGWIDRARFVEIANGVLEWLWTSPVRYAPNARIQDEFWTDRWIKDLPYHRGDVVAMIADRAIRTASGGERSLDDVMRDLVEEARETGRKVDTDGLLERLRREGGEGAATLRAIVVDGALPRLPEDLFAPCLELRMVEAPTFDLGFDLDASTAAHVVAGVRQGSAAEKAGLRDGQKLVGWSVHGGDATREVVLQLGEPAGPSEIRYLPHGAVVLLPRLFTTDSSDCACL